MFFFPLLPNDQAYFRFLHGAHETGTRFRFLTTRYCPSGECAPMLDEVVDGGVGDIFVVVEAVCASNKASRCAKYKFGDKGL